MPNSADELLAEAIKRDIYGRLEQAMLDDEVVSEFLNNSPATVVFDVVIDRDAEEAETRPLAFRGEERDDVPFVASIGRPAVAAMVASMRKRIGRAESAPLATPDEPFFFEIAVHPDPVLPLGA
jgi:hypothetical protein